MNKTIKVEFIEQHLPYGDNRLFEFRVFIDDSPNEAKFVAVSGSPDGNLNLEDKDAWKKLAASGIIAHYKKLLSSDDYDSRGNIRVTSYWEHDISKEFTNFYID